MRRVVPLLVASLLAGCAGDAPQAPLLANPKVLVDRSEADLTHVYVHSAFGDHEYARILVRVDNETVADEARAYAVDVRVPTRAFHLAIDVNASLVNWTLEAIVALDEEEGSGTFAIWDARERAFDDPRASDLPWQKILGEARGPEDRSA